MSKRTILSAFWHISSIEPSLRLHSNKGGDLTQHIVSHERLYHELDACQIDCIEVNNIQRSTYNLTRPTRIHQELLERIGLVTSSSAENVQSRHRESEKEHVVSQKIEIYPVTRSLPYATGKHGLDYRNIEQMNVWLKKSDSLLKRLLRLPTKITYKALGIGEKRLSGLLSLKNHFPPLFLIGPPRSGTTLLYLHLVNTFQFAYFPNIAKYYPQACATYTLLGKFFATTYKPTYHNRYGFVSGLMSPSDGWEIFARWFPTYDLSQPVQTDRLYELKNLIRFFEGVYHSPFINRNIGNSLRIPTLNMLFPDALFIFITRNVNDTVSSLLEARKRHGREVNQWWCTPPPQFYTQQFETELEQAVAQVIGIIDYARKDITKISPERWKEISYESFCRSPATIEEWIYTQYKKLGIHLTFQNTTRPYSFQDRSSKIENRSKREEQIEEIVKNLKRSL